MREIHRTLTTRIPILAISFICGCALNFGQVNASGTVAQNPSDGQQQAASPAPSTTPTEAPRGRLTVLQNFSYLDSWKDPKGQISFGFDFGLRPFYPIFITARERNISSSAMTFTRIGTGLVADDALRDIRLSFSTIGTVQSLPSLKNGIAQFSNENGLTVFPKDVTVGVSLWATGLYPRNEQMAANYSSKKTIGFALKKSSDIRTDGLVDIIGTFPLDGPDVHFCCYGGNLTPNE